MDERRIGQPRPMLKIGKTAPVPLMMMSPDQPPRAVHGVDGDRATDDQNVPLVESTSALPLLVSAVFRLPP